MARYGKRPVRMWIEDDLSWRDSTGETEGRDVYDSPSLEDQPTGILDADGSMIYRLANQIGFLADN